MLRLDRIPLHWKTQTLLARFCSTAGRYWTPPARPSWYGSPSPKNRRKILRDFFDRHGVTVQQATKALRDNYRWHEQHPGKVIRHGDIPF